MSNLPLGWSMKTIGEVCEKPQYGWTTKARKDVGEGLRLLRTTDITQGSVDWGTVPYCTVQPPEPEKYLLHDGDIVVSRAGSVGVSLRIRGPEPSAFASYLIRLRPLRDIDTDYVAWFLKSPEYWRQVERFTAGIALQNINAKKLASITLPVPPISEQHRIVGAIEEQFSRLDAAEASIRRSRKQLYVFRASALANSFAGDHPVKLLGELADTQLGKMLSQKANKGRGQPYLRNKNVQWARFDLGDVAKMEFSDAEAEKFILRSGDVLVCEGGEVGRAAIWHDELEVCFYQKALHRVRPHGELLPEFLMYYLRRLADTNGFDRYVTGSTIDHLPQEDLRVIPVPAPSTDIQSTIVASVERLMSLAAAMESQLDAALARSAALRRAVLRDAFSGRLTGQLPVIAYKEATA